MPKMTQQKRDCGFKVPVSKNIGRRRSRFQQNQPSFYYNKNCKEESVNEMIGRWSHWEMADDWEMGDEVNLEFNTSDSTWCEIYCLVQQTDQQNIPPHNRNQKLDWKNWLLEILSSLKLLNFIIFLHTQIVIHEQNTCDMSGAITTCAIDTGSEQPFRSTRSLNGVEEAFSFVLEDVSWRGGASHIR